MSNPRQPAIFFGHGSPMNAIEGPYNREWRALGERLQKPEAVLMVSAHWFVEETAVTAMAHPKTIHDFYGFPQTLFDIQYPAPGDAALAARAQALLAPVPVRADQEWGLDHGTWSVLRHVFPHAEIPIVQLAIDARQPAAFHYDLGRKLAPLRDEGVLIAGSGDVVHNLRIMNRDGGEAYPWAARFNDFVKDRIRAGDHPPLIEADMTDEAVRLSIPTPEHYLPLLYVLGAAAPGEAPSFFTDAIDLASISMLGVAFG